MRNICFYKKFMDHPFLCKMVLGAPDGPIFVQHKPCTARLICTQNRSKLSYRGVLHHFGNPKVKSFSLYLIKKSHLPIGQLLPLGTAIRYEVPDR